ncbi:MAG: SMC family ATPase [Spirochaetales bacterium]|nr:SMC family ATPase [Spirochaetales bacterium]
MIPVRLKMAGFYSYRREVDIDFRPLTAASLFGIFGPVGSGKSSILEAITLALYGESARLNQRDSRSYNMLNLRSDRLSVDFEFLSRDGGTYRFTVAAKRDKKRVDSAGSFARRAYVRDADGGEWRPLEAPDAEGVIGLNYANFRRTTIIPQGRFQEFLQLGGGERTAMMKELFQLERFDLYRPATTLYNRARREYEAVQAALSELPAELQTRVEAAEKERADLRTRGEEARAERARAAEELAALEKHVRLTEERARLLRETADLDAQRDEIETLGERVSVLEFLRDRIRFFLEERERTRRAVEETRLRLEETTQKVGPAQARLDAALSRRETLVQRNAHKGVLARRRDALRLAAARRDLVESTERERGEAERLRSEATIGEQQERDMDSAIKELREGLPDREELRRRGTVIDAARNRRRSRERLRRLRGEALREFGVDDPSRIEGTLAALVERRARAEAHRRAADIDHHLAALADRLTEGEPCPLCGSIHHPVAHRLEAASGESAPSDLPSIEEIDRRIEALRGLRTTLEALDREEAALVDGEDGEPAVTDDPERAARDVEEAWKRHDRIEARRETLERIREQRRDVEKRLAAHEASLRERDGRMKTLAADIAALVDELAEEERRRFEMEAESEPRQRADEIDEAIDRLEAELGEAGRLTEERSRETERLRAQQDERREQYERVVAEGAEAEEALRRELTDSPRAIRDADDEQLATYLSDLPHIADYRRRIERYREARRTVADRLRAIEDELGDRPYAPDALDRAREGVRLLEEEIRRIDTRTGAVESGLDLARRQLVRHTELAERETHLATRIEDIQTVRNLFKGAGFVGYVAQVYLEQLVAAANERFRRLTRNQLHLALRGDRDFEVIDYLNGGRRRSIKTLSGGQTFQAALCLALALVDSIDRGGSDGELPGFFFLDEGFGSLDGEALQDVFATLKDLRKEHRIVGVISHVEALQQEIDARLRVELDEDEGSRIARPLR